MTAPNPRQASSWAQWLQAQLDERGWIQADLVRRSGGKASRPQVSRWLTRGATPDLESIRTVCEALGVPTAEGMIAAGLLTPEDIEVTVVERHRSARDMSNGELLAELSRRLIPDEEQDLPPAPPISIPRISPEDLGVEGEHWAARRRRERDDQ